ncbi:MAG: polyphosphate polymerase domain-containing protein [Oscillospiraceae bacterium]|nr:polyphosphate polymerase domain-containing protein [Oscillospiraceae bacterium]
MANIQNIFSRYEKKYLTDAAAWDEFFARISPYICPDPYGETRICNCYYDTPEHLLIRRSLDKPRYKEKLRLRCYGVPTEESIAFAEVKKKYNGVVYKRRIPLPYREAVAFLSGGEAEIPAGDAQIAREIQWMFRLYPGLSPALALHYLRSAYYASDDPALRITVDSDVRFRTYDLDLRAGESGELLLPPDARLLELKIAGAMPLWLSSALDACRIFPTSFSKYGRAYQRLLQEADDPLTLSIGGSVYA